MYKTRRDGPKGASFFDGMAYKLIRGDGVMGGGEIGEQKGLRE